MWLGRAVRLQDWWDYKLSVIVLVFAATALELRVSLAQLWPTALLLLLALVVGAVFASIINDLTDAVEDAVAGKPNVVSRLPRGVPQVLLAITMMIGAGLIWLWRDASLVILAYLGAWLAFAAYSVRPVRLKARAGYGVVAMGFGEAALPSLFAAALCGHAAARPLDPVWLGAVAVWSFGHGLRAILWHQLGDEAADRHAAVDTFVQRRGAKVVQSIALCLVLPAEAAGLAALLVWMDSALPVLALALYLLMLALRIRIWREVAVVVVPAPRHILLLQDYYLVFLPISAGLALAWQHPVDAAALAVFLVLFSRPVQRCVGQAYWLTMHALG